MAIRLLRSTKRSPNSAWQMAMPSALRTAGTVRVGVLAIVTERDGTRTSLYADVTLGGA